MPAAPATRIPGSKPSADVPLGTDSTPNHRFDELPSEDQIQSTIRALESNGIHTVVVDNKEEARRAVLALIPEGEEVYDGTSQTLLAIGLPNELQQSGRYQLIRPQLMQLYQDGKLREQRKLGASPDYIVGSVHAVTEAGKVVIASASGSQLGPYAYGAGKVIWVVGAQKLVSNLDEAFRRIEEYTFPLENERAKKAYGQGSSISKVLIVNREMSPGRTTMILVKENLGF